ncbi:MAG: prepilin-type N-terminal cleavage/methylation domain-containing protein [Phycisphaerae bacterium]|nr:prepilin-type N-terminal cleavage/methylation domain-containing protein [Phycisphaerae bacterium]
MKANAFTLVEILIVVIIIGILAAIVIPQFSSAAMESQEAMMMENLRVMRTQISIYRAQHDGMAPGYKGANLSEQNFIDQLTKFTDQNGNVDESKSDVFRYGPYLSVIPENPLTKASAVQVIQNADDMPAEPTGGNEIGWIYKAAEIDFRANSVGNDLSGESYYEY